jgi:hypothetical protein
MFHNYKFRFGQYDELRKYLDSTCSHNGTEFKRIFYQLDGRTSGFISERAPLDFATYDPLYYAEKHLRNYIDGYKEGIVSLRRVKQQQYEGKQYTMIEFRKDKSFAKFFIDPEQGYKVFFVEEGSRETAGFVKMVTTIEYQTIGSVLFPRHVSRQLLHGGQQSVVKDFAYSDNWQLNIPIDDGDFELSFPEGTEIHNTITREEYTQQ